MEDYGTVSLTLDDGSVLECVILTIYPAAGKEYIALLPTDENGETGEEVFIYRYIEVDGEPDLENIIDDEEYEIALDAFDEWVDTQEWEELDGE